MRSEEERRLSTVTKVKVLSLDILINAEGEGFEIPEANHEVRDRVSAWSPAGV